MADLDFNITIKTVADTTGIKLTEQGLNAIKVAALQGNQQAIEALKNLTAAQKAASEATAGSTGSVVGIGTMVSLLTKAIFAVKQFNDEEDKLVEKEIEAAEKARLFGLEVADAITDHDFTEKLKLAPLQTQFDTLTQRARVLDSEMRTAFESGDSKGAQGLLRQLEAMESRIDRVTAALNRQKQAEEKAAEERQKQEESFMAGAVASSDSQTKAAIINEDAARKARAAGRDKEADQFQKTADQLKKSMTPEQQEQYDALTNAGPKLSDIDRNKINFDRQLRGEPPLPQGNPSGTGALEQAIENAFSRQMDKYWGH